jgi:hypothetical protein
MASRNLTLRAGGAAGKSDTIYTDLSTSFKLGTRAWDDQGNEYVFIKGVSSGAANDVVVIDEDYGTTRLAPDEVGPVGVLDAAIDATTKGGWAQVYVWRRPWRRTRLRPIRRCSSTRRRAGSMTRRWPGT